MRSVILSAALCAAIAPVCPGAEKDDLRTRAAQGLRKAVAYFTGEVSTEGGYLWRYSEDLSQREGEGRATATQVWVQPPGTPSVGMALLQAYRDTQDPYYLEAARRAGLCLARGQLRSGGWDYRIEFDPKRRGEYAYRLDPATGRQKRNVSTLDDSTTQSAVRFLVELDEVLKFGDAQIHEAAASALAALLDVQYPNGAWPQRFEGPADPKAFPVKKASYPESWSRTFPHEKYASYYTFNDNLVGDMIGTLLEATRVYGDARYRQAAIRTGDFLILAQMPDPQPGWAQQYNAEMHPAWARKFEPPSITGGESRDVVQALMRIYVETGDRKYLEPIPRALAYYRGSVLGDGRLARFYELHTNKPLYFTKDYQLTYSDADMPTHYAFKTDNWLPRAEVQYERAGKLDAAGLAALRKGLAAEPGKRRGRANRAMEERVEKVLADMDARGRWIDTGRFSDDKSRERPMIQCATFIKNVGELSSYLGSKSK